MSTLVLERPRSNLLLTECEGRKEDIVVSFVMKFSGQCSDAAFNGDMLKKSQLMQLVQNDDAGSTKTRHID